MVLISGVPGVRVTATHRTGTGTGAGVSSWYRCRVQYWSSSYGIEDVRKAARGSTGALPGLEFEARASPRLVFPRLWAILRLVAALATVVARGLTAVF